MNTVDYHGLYVCAESRLEDLRADAARQAIADQLPRTPSAPRVVLARSLRALARVLSDPPQQRLEPEPVC